MVTTEFSHPSEDELVDAFGVGSIPVGGEPTLRFVELDLGAEGTVQLSFDVALHSIALTWSKRDETIVNIYREHATKLSVMSGAGEGWIRAEFQSATFNSNLSIRVYPQLSIDDSLLMTDQ